MKDVKIIIIQLIIMICSIGTVSAVPADRTPRTVVMSDGTEVMVILRGDEHFSWMETMDGRIVEPSEDGKSFVYSNKTKAEIYGKVQEARLKAPRKIGSQATAPLPSKGKVKIPVILTQFKDSVFTVGKTYDEIRSYYDRYCNGTRDGNLYKGHGSYGAIRDYFIDQSDGLFDPEFVIIGPVTLSNTETYYVSRNSAYVRESVNLATQSYAGTWSDFDNRGKGQVDMVFLIFAGCGSNTTGDRSNHIWPYETNIGTVTLSDGSSVKFACSGCCSENQYLKRQGVPYVRADGIGVMCHELSHALGLPDFYDTSYKAFGMDLWSLMDYGCYGDGGYTPCSYTAYERDFMGWRSMETLNENGTVFLDPISDGGIGYKIFNDENVNEYYIVENRQDVGWDTGIFKRAKTGLQVTHVDYNASKWKGNNINTEATHQRMTIIAANNRYIGTSVSNDGSELIKTWAGNLYPYAYTDDSGVKHCNDSLTTYSIPAAQVFTSNGYMNKDIHEIRELDDRRMSFYFGNDYVVGVQPLMAEDARENRGKDVWYDMTGRKVTRPNRAGLYISQSGKKISVR